MTRAWLAPLSPIYGAGVGAKNYAYERGWLAAQRLRQPVISVGNLSVGGSGKTPLTIRLAELLSGQGLAVDVLSRGYGRSSRAVERVDPGGGAERGADRFGDEPLLIARRTGLPVFVGASRYEAGLLAESAAMSQDRGNSTSEGLAAGHSSLAVPLPAVHLLDDGFQHRQLFRDVDIVALHRSDFAEGLLPAGRLREPLAALRRADFAVLREQDAEFQEQLAHLGVRAEIWWMRRNLDLPPGLAGRRVAAFCGIARPEELFSSLTAGAATLALAKSFSDHHRYVRADAQGLAAAAAAVRAEAFATTEKDAVKLDSGMLKILEAVAPVCIARLEVTLRDEARVVRQLLEQLR